MTGVLTIGGTELLSWSPTDDGQGGVAITGGSIAYAFYTEAEGAKEKATLSSGTPTSLTGTLTESPSGTYSANIVVPTGFVEGGWYTAKLTLTATGLTAIRFIDYPARWPKEDGN